MKLANGIAAFGLLLAAAALALAGERASPGALATVHAREALGGTQGCAQCHADSGRSMADACMSCHDDIGSSLADASGLHGGLEPALARDCSRCHGEHQGSGFPMVGTGAFVRAGYAGLDAYAHEGLEYHLVGAHIGLSCEHCHSQARVAVLPPEGKRFLGLAQDCTGCHEDTHKGTYGGDCASCHGQARPFKDVDGFEHQTFCPLVGSHSNLQCTDCHAEGSDHSVLTLATRHAEHADATGDERDCVGCHDSPHREPFVEGVLALAGPAASVGALPATAGTSCRLCHSAAHETFEGVHADMDVAWHAASGFGLEAPHDKLDCAACHPGVGTRAVRTGPPSGPARAPGSPSRDLPGRLVLADGSRRTTVDRDAFLTDYPGRTADDCAACHGDPHDSQFMDGAAEAARCIDCHDRHAFTPSTFDAEDHAATALPLEGPHADAACNDCHLLPAGEPGDTPEGRACRRFADVDTTCSTCHVSPHHGAFLKDAAQRLSVDGESATCARCHAALDEQFAGEHGETARRVHAASGFALEPPHEAVSCDKCHAGFGERKLAEAATTPPRVDPVLPAMPVAGSFKAFVDAYPGRGADDCKACHDDPHEGQFAGGAYAGQDCLSCHDRHAFMPPAFDDDHHGRTRFPLTGAHLAVGCSECHRKNGEMLERAEGSAAAAAIAPEVLTGTARQFTGTPADCAACHSDVHDGHFDAAGQPADVGGRTGCARCHVTESFRVLSAERFDHGLWTGYALEGAHAPLDCAACHARQSTPDAEGRTFGEARGTRCEDCHVPGSVPLDGPEQRR